MEQLKQQLAQALEQVAELDGIVAVAFQRISDLENSAKEPKEPKEYVAISCANIMLMTTLENCQLI